MIWPVRLHERLTLLPLSISTPFLVTQFDCFGYDVCASVRVALETLDALLTSAVLNGPVLIRRHILKHLVETPWRG